MTLQAGQNLLVVWSGPDRTLYRAVQCMQRAMCRTRVSIRLHAHRDGLIGRMSLLMQVAQLKRGAAQATERVSRSEANLRSVKAVADEDKETLRCVGRQSSRPSLVPVCASTHLGEVDGES